jgi:hypothetical protein
MFPVIAESKSTLLVKKFSERLTFLCRVPRAKALPLSVNDFKYGNPHGQASLRPWHPVPTALIHNRYRIKIIFIIMRM